MAKLGYAICYLEILNKQLLLETMRYRECFTLKPRIYKESQYELEIEWLYYRLTISQEPEPSSNAIQLARAGTETLSR
jgi:hypothetical protein